MTQYIGIDVSKDFLDVAVGEDPVFRVTNNEEGQLELLKRMKKVATPLVVLEATGGFEIEVVLLLGSGKIPVAVVNPRQVRAFANALGISAKTDVIDARVLAKFGAATSVEAQPLPDEESLELEALLLRRRQLVSMLAMERNRLSTFTITRRPGGSTAVKSIQQTIDYLVKQLESLEKSIQNKLHENKVWRDKEDLLRSVPGVGKVLAQSLIIDLPELGLLDRRRIAALVGIAPFNRDSGHSVGKRHIRGGRASIRAVLYMACVASLRCNPVIKAFYTKLRETKPVKLALVACMRKLLVILNAMVKSNSRWSPALETP